MRLYGRRLELLVSDDEGRTIDLGALSCSFEVTRLSVSGLNRARISVYNLSRDTIARLSETYRKVVIRAGYADRFGTLFSGEIKYVFPTSEGPDHLTDIFAADGAKDYEHAWVSMSFAPGTSLRDAVRGIASSFAAVTVGDLTGVPDVEMTGARVESGKARDVLDRLAVSYGFEWSIQNGRLQIGSDAVVPAVRVSRDSGMIGSPQASTIGVSVKTLLDPRLVPGARMVVETAGAKAQINEQLLVGGGIRLSGIAGGTFDVLRSVHSGETRGQAWYTDAFGVEHRGA